MLPLTYFLPFSNCEYYIPVAPQFCTVSSMRVVEDNCIIQQIFVLVGVVSIVSFINLLMILVIAIVLSVIFCRLACKYKETRITLCRTLILLGFFAAYFVILLTSGTWALQTYIFELLIAVFLLPGCYSPLPSCSTSILLICFAGEQSRELQLNGDASAAAVEEKMNQE